MTRAALSLGLGLLLAGIAGCVTDERAVDNPDDVATGVGRVTVLALARTDMVRLRWMQEPPKGGHISYLVTWRPASGEIAAGDTGTEFVNWHDGTESIAFSWREFTAEVGPLREKLYEFRVNAMKSGERTPATSPMITAAPADRYVDDVSRPGEPIRVYEPGSSMGGDGLVIDPSKGGPRVVGISGAEVGSVQLAMVIANGDPVLQIASTTEWSTSGKCDPHVYTPTDAAADQFYTHIPLDEWYSRAPGPLFSSTWVPSGRYFFVIAGGRGLYRLGEEGDPSARYVRVSTVEGPDGVFLQGTAPNRYVELELSVGHPGVPFA